MRLMKLSKSLLLSAMLLCSFQAFSEDNAYKNDYCLEHIGDFLKNNPYAKSVNRKTTQKEIDHTINTYNFFKNKKNVNELFSGQQRNIKAVHNINDEFTMLSLLVQYDLSDSSESSFLKLMRLSIYRNTLHLLKKKKKTNNPILNMLEENNIAFITLSLPQTSFMLIDNELSFSDFNDNSNNEKKFIQLITEDYQQLNKNQSDSSSTNETKDEIHLYTASYIQEIYDKNEVKGDLKFKGKQFYVTGAIASIDSSLNDQPAVHFATDTGNQFQSPTAFFKDYENKLEQIADLSKGQEIKLLCTGNGEMVGSPMLSDCEFAKSELDLYVDQIIKNNGDSVELKGGYDIDNLYLSVKTLSSVLPDDSACFNNEYDQCKTELLALPDYKIRAAANRYHLSRDKIHEAIRKDIDDINQQMIKKYNNSKEINQIIEFKEKCYVPIIMNLF